MHRNVKGKMADTYSYVSGKLRCALFPLFVDGILRNTNKKKCSKWSHQNNFAHFLVSTRPNLLLFSNKRKTVKIGQNAFTLNQGDTPLVTWCKNNMLRQRNFGEVYHSLLFYATPRGDWGGGDLSTQITNVGKNCQRKICIE